MQQRGIGGGAHPDVLVARIADHGEIVVALHGRLAQPLQLDLHNSICSSIKPAERRERQIGARWPLCQSLTAHMVQRKLQRLTFSISSLTGNPSTSAPLRRDPESGLCFRPALRASLKAPASREFSASPSPCSGAGMAAERALPICERWSLPENRLWEYFGCRGSCAP